MHDDVSFGATIIQQLQPSSKNQYHRRETSFSSSLCLICVYELLGTYEGEGPTIDHQYERLPEVVPPPAEVDSKFESGVWRGDGSYSPTVGVDLDHGSAQDASLWC